MLAITSDAGHTALYNTSHRHHYY